MLTVKFNSLTVDKLGLFERIELGSFIIVNHTFVILPGIRKKNFVCVKYLMAQVLMDTK